jgi:hypothetical protein
MRKTPTVLATSMPENTATPTSRRLICVASHAIPPRIVIVLQLTFIVHLDLEKNDRGVGGADRSPSLARRRLVQRRLDCSKSLVNPWPQFRMRKYVQFILADRSEHEGGNLRRV